MLLTVQDLVECALVKSFQNLDVLVSWCTLTTKLILLSSILISNFDMAFVPWTNQSLLEQQTRVHIVLLLLIWATIALVCSDIELDFMAVSLTHIGKVDHGVLAGDNLSEQILILP